MKSIHHVVDIDASPATVWSVLTEADRLARWWSTKVRTDAAALGTQVHWTFAGDFNPVMEITTLDVSHELQWRCVAGHEPWKNSMFRFQLHGYDTDRTRLRFWQDYAIELDDDAYGIYNFNWGYYLESLRLLASTGAGKPFAA
jgi:uncharacterized protein YndB with AHSA1/START domain